MSYRRYYPTEEALTLFRIQKQHSKFPFFLLFCISFRIETRGQAHFCGQQMQHLGWLLITQWLKVKCGHGQNESLVKSNYLNFTVLEEMCKSLIDFIMFFFVVAVK